MLLLAFQCLWDVGILENIEHPIVWENVVTAEFVIGRDVSRTGRKPLALNNQRQVQEKPGQYLHNLLYLQRW